MTLFSQLQNLKQTTFSLAQLSERQRNLFLSELTNQLRKNKREIFKSNTEDIKNARKQKLPDSYISRLQFGSHELERLLQKIRAIKRLHGYLFEAMEKKRVEDGLLLQKVRVPIGVLFVIYESRPEVTIETACLALKSGNGVILRGGSDALHTNKALYLCIQYALKKAKIADAVLFIEDCAHRKVYQLLQMGQYIDLVIARGGYEMVRDIQSKSKIPVLAHAAGGARIYVDKSADLEMACKIILNAKLSKPAACNSVDTVLVHREIADIFLPRLLEKLNRYRVKIYIDQVHHVIPTTVEGSLANASNLLRRAERFLGYARNDHVPQDLFSKEFLGKEIAIKVVSGPEEAIDHIRKYTKGHTEGLVAQDEKVIDTLIHSIDAASVMVNCSPRLHDGYVYGLGAEMGIATGKLHVRGPVGLEGLTTYKWVVKGKGQIRK